MGNESSKWGSSNAVSAIMLKLRMLNLRMARLQAAEKANRAIAVMVALVPTEPSSG